MQCELIALACLVAHGDMGGKKLRKEWNPDKIIAQLEPLHPEFFPRPEKFNIMNPSADSPGHIHLVAKSSGDTLTKDELVQLWGRTGNELHRGNVRKLLKPQTPLQTHFPEVLAWQNRIIRLLDQHRISSSDNLHHILCVLSGPGGNIQVGFASAPAPNLSP